MLTSLSCESHDVFEAEELIIELIRPSWSLSLTHRFFEWRDFIVGASSGSIDWIVEACRSWDKLKKTTWVDHTDRDIYVGIGSWKQTVSAIFLSLANNMSLQSRGWDGCIGPQQFPANISQPPSQPGSGYWEQIMGYPRKNLSLRRYHGLCSYWTSSMAKDDFSLRVLLMVNPFSVSSSCKPTTVSVAAPHLAFHSRDVK